MVRSSNSDGGDILPRLNRDTAKARSLYVNVRVGALSSSLEVYLSAADGIESEGALAFISLSSSGSTAFPTDLVTS